MPARATDLPRTEEELLEREQIRAQRELRTAFREARCEVTERLELRRQFERHPLVFVSSAVLVGLAMGGPVRRLLGKRLGRGLFLSLLAFSARSGIQGLLSGWMPTSSLQDVLRSSRWLRDQFGAGGRRGEGYTRNH